MQTDRLREEIDRLFEALQAEMVINQALIDILVNKGVFGHDELQEKIRQIKIRSGIVLSSSATGEKPQ